jgi:hypothetical protein
MRVKTFLVLPLVGAVGSAHAQAPAVGSDTRTTVVRAQWLIDGTSDQPRGGR